MRLVRSITLVLDYFVTCDGCHNRTAFYRDRADALAAWNRRAPGPGAADLTAALDAVFPPDGWIRLDADSLRNARAAIAKYRGTPATPDPDPADAGADCLRGTLGT